MNIREYQVGFCKACQNSMFDSSKGIICKLTKEIADFEHECDNFEGDRSKIPFIITKKESKDISNHQQDSVDDYPPKPYEDEKKQSLKKSFISVFIFIAAFYLIFRWEFQYILILTGVIFIHELGHLLAMKVFKYKELSMFFIPLMGAAASGKKDNVTQKQKVIIALSGPLPGIIIGSIIYAQGYVFENELYMKIGNIFIYLNLFNLLPIMPLDGGWILKSLFFSSNEKISIVFLWISIALITVIALKIKAFLLFLVPVLLFTQINLKTEYLKIRKLLINDGFDIKKDYNELSDKEYWLLRDELAINMKSFSKMIEVKRYIETANESRVINALKQILIKPPLKKIGVGGKIAFVFIWLLTFLTPPIVLLIYHIMGLIK